ncbi:hypothetical protein BP00DRAFT_252437 [Aspergillus indologenus CBS 114.80]|uniref:Uncharacterized protein n=1 Tax=Aspergillus indologenus CBS 114.80 TaxID=1450541 RepID=A0A2V5IMM9_9EURO|nr:hypothetical protein BP00DRAFT_252437 [Aspergillus indologenus CBS 114.80]
MFSPCSHSHSLLLPCSSKKVCPACPAHSHYRAIAELTIVFVGGRVLCLATVFQGDAATPTPPAAAAAAAAAAVVEFVCFQSLHFPGVEVMRGDLGPGFGRFLAGEERGGMLDRIHADELGNALGHLPVRRRRNHQCRGLRRRVRRLRRAIWGRGRQRGSEGTFGGVGLDGYTGSMSLYSRLWGKVQCNVQRACHACCWAVRVSTSLICCALAGPGGSWRSPWRVLLAAMDCTGQTGRRLLEGGAP